MKYLAILAAGLALASFPAGCAFAQTAIGVGTGTASSSSNSAAAASSRSNGNSLRNNNPRQAPGIGLSGLAASTACLGSGSIGGSAVGGSFGFGFTYADSPCNRREDARIMAQLGRRDIALQIMYQSPNVQAVLQAQNVPVAYAPARGRPVARPSAANGGLPAPCRQWVGGVVGGLCSY